MINKENIKKFWEEHKKEITEGLMNAAKYAAICGGVALIFKGGCIVGEKAAADNISDFCRKLVEKYPDVKVVELNNPEQFEKWYCEIYQF